MKNNLGVFIERETKVVYKIGSSKTANIFEEYLEGHTTDLTVAARRLRRKIKIDDEVPIFIRRITCLTNKYEGSFDNITSLVIYDINNKFEKEVYKNDI